MEIYMKKSKTCKYPTSIPICFCWTNTHLKLMKKDSNWPPVATTRLELDPGRLGFGPLRSSQGLAGKCQRSIWSAEVGDHRKTAEVLTWKIVSCQEIARRPNNGYICVLKDVSCTWKKLGFLMIALSVLHWYICCFQLFPIKKGAGALLPSNSANRLKFLGLLELFRNETGTGSSVRCLHDLNNQIYRSPNKHDFSWVGLKVRAHFANSIGLCPVLKLRF